MKCHILILLLLLCMSCSKESDPEVVQPRGNYFPPIASSDWETSDISSLGWASDMSNLMEYLDKNNTRAFIVVKDGRIVIEEYWGKDILGISDFSQSSQWYWASAGKSLTAMLVGLAQQEGYLDIQSSTSKYLGNGWTNMTSVREEEIKVFHQLTMTTGLDYAVSNVDCTAPGCLVYRATPGSQWFYHNAPYTLLKAVVEAATGKGYNEYTDEKLEKTIGLKGVWRDTPQGQNVYWSSARDAARFGLIILNEGDWDGVTILSDKNYYRQMVQSSQQLNPSYGYLWWLNGKGEIIYPGVSVSLPVDYTPSAPSDLISAAGKNGQFIDIVPSENLVVIRMGEAPDGAQVPISFHDEMWGHLMKIMKL